MQLIILRNSGKPELRCNPSHLLELFTKKMDARVISAFTRVFRRAMPGHDVSENHSGPAYFPAVAGNIDLTIFIFEMSTVASMCRKTAASR